MKKFLLIILIIYFCQLQAIAAREFKEVYYQNAWCSRWNGVQEYKLPDKTRVDCLTKNYAVEFDFAPKWAEAYGQATYYGFKTNKKPAIILIIEKPSDFKHYYKLEKICKNNNITLWYMKSPVYQFKNINKEKFNIENVLLASIEVLKGYFYGKHHPTEK